jgi:hypothetical protein
MVIPASLSRVLQLYAARPEGQGFFIHDFASSHEAFHLCQSVNESAARPSAAAAQTSRPGKTPPGNGPICIEELSARATAKKKYSAPQFCAQK